LTLGRNVPGHVADVQSGGQYASVDIKCYRVIDFRIADRVGTFVEPYVAAVVAPDFSSVTLTYWDGRVVHIAL
jgi:hypothetical protein